MNDRKSPTLSSLTTTSLNARSPSSIQPVHSGYIPKWILAVSQCLQIYELCIEVIVDSVSVLPPELPVYCCWTQKISVLVGDCVYGGCDLHANVVIQRINIDFSHSLLIASSEYVAKGIVARCLLTSGNDVEVKSSSSQLVDKEQMVNARLETTLSLLNSEEQEEFMSALERELACIPESRDHISFLWDLL